MDFGTRLKEARGKIGLNQEEIAQSIGVSRQTISNWENNRSLPDLRSIVEISDIYRISLDDLLKGDRKVMEKLIKDSDVKKMGSILNVSTIFTMMSSTALVLYPNYNSTVSQLLAVMTVCSMIILIFNFVRFFKINQHFQAQTDASISLKSKTPIIVAILLFLALIGFAFGYFLA